MPGDFHERELGFWCLRSSLDRPCAYGAKRASVHQSPNRRSTFPSGTEKRSTTRFHWLREKSSPEVIQYLEAENAYTKAMTKRHPALRRHPLQGNARPHQADRPQRARSPWLISITIPAPRKGNSTPFSAARRRRGTVQPSEGAEEVLLDLNELAKGVKFLSLGDFEVSDDANLLAYTTDTHGLPPIPALRQRPPHRRGSAR